MATEVIRSIKASGGDYATIALWTAAIPANLVTADEQWTGELYNETYAETVSISGHTVDATRFIKLSVASGQRHNGKQGTGAVINPSAGSTGTGISISDQYTVIEWLELTDWGSSGWMSSGIVINADNCTIRFNIVHDEVADNSGSGISYGGGSNCKIYRNIVYETGTPTMRNGIHDGNGWFSGNIVNNNTVHNFSENCIHKDVADVNTTYQNNCATNPGSGFSCFAIGSGASTASNNLSSDATAPGTSAQINKSASNQFISISGTYDLRLKAGADCIDNGANLGSPYDTGIQGNAVTGTWDIGADELIPEGQPINLKHQCIPFFGSRNWRNPFSTIVRS